MTIAERGDARDNITYKSDVGRYWYDAARPNRMTQVTLETAPGAQVALNGTRALSYAFDDTKPGAQVVGGTSVGNGNLLYTVSQDTPNNRHTVRAETYTSFNMPLQIVFGNFVTATTSTADRTLTFVYGPEHQRIRQTVALSGTGTSSYTSGTTWYLNGVDSLGLAYEKHVTTAGLTEHKHYVSAGSQVFALQVTRSGNLGTQTTSTTSYLHTDHLGSVAVITDASAAVAERLAYDPWGKRRFASGLRDNLDAITGQKTDRGYTLHEHLDEVGVVHMNARVYDPLIGRFMSADSVLPDPTNLKAFNRYSYVWNNPLALVDPTGHFVDAVSGATVGTESPGNGAGGGCLISMGCGWATVYIADSWDSASTGKDLPAAQGAEPGSESGNSPAESPGKAGAGDDSYQIASAAARFGAVQQGAQGATGGAVPPQQAIDRGQNPTHQLQQVIISEPRLNFPSLDAMRFGVPMFVPFIGWVMDYVVWSTGRIDNALNVNSAENGGASNAQPPKNPQPITNPPQEPPIPEGWTIAPNPKRPGGIIATPPGATPGSTDGEQIRVDPPGASPVSGLEDGYWRWNRPGAGWYDPGRGKFGGGQGQTHVPLPPGYNIPQP